MNRFFSGGRLFAFLAAVILLVVLAGVSLRSRLTQVSWPEKFAIDITSVVGRAFYGPVFQVETFFSRLKDLENLYAENAALKKTASENLLLQIQLNQAQKENQQLKSMLHYQGKSPQFHLIAGEVTGRSPLSWNSEIVLSVGQKAGVGVTMPVLDQNGDLIGRVQSVAAYSSAAELLTSSETADGVSASIVSGGAPVYGVISGSPTKQGYYLMQFISQLATNIHPGDVVVTSGLSNIYPKGIPIGRVVSFISDGTSITRSALVKPLANMNQLNYVFVLAPKPGQVQP